MNAVHFRIGKNLRQTVRLNKRCSLALRVLQKCPRENLLLITLIIYFIIGNIVSLTKSVNSIGKDPTAEYQISIIESVVI